MDFENHPQWPELRDLIVRKWSEGVAVWDIATRLKQRFKIPVRSADVREMVRAIGLPEESNQTRSTGEVLYPVNDPWPARHHFRGQDVPDRGAGRMIRFRATERHCERPAGAAA